MPPHYADIHRYQRVDEARPRSPSPRARSPRAERIPQPREEPAPRPVDPPVEHRREPDPPAAAPRGPPPGYGPYPGFAPQFFGAPPQGLPLNELRLDKDNLVGELEQLFATHENSTNDGEKRTAKADFYSRYTQYLTVFDKITDMAGSIERTNLRMELDRVNRRKSRIGPLESPHRIRQRIYPPEFDGDTLNYHGWATQWAVFDNDPSYSLEDKYQMLNRCLKKSAAEVTRGLPCNHDNYQKMKDMLKERFGSETQAINLRKSQMRQASNLPKPADYTASQLREKYDGIHKQISNLESLGERQALYDDEIANNTLASLPHTLTQIWQRQWGANTKPTLNQVLMALRTEINVKETDEIRRSSTDSQQDASINFVNTNKARERRKRTPTPALKHCFLCEGNSHQAYRCVIGTREERQAKLKALNKCFKCLGDGHTVRDCPKDYQCIICYSQSHQLVTCPQKEEQERHRQRQADALNATGERSTTPQRGRSPGVRVNQNSGTRPQSRSRSRTRHPSATNTNPPAQEVQANMNICLYEGKTKADMSPLVKGKIRLTDGRWRRVNIMLDTGSSASFIRKKTIEPVIKQSLGVKLLRLSTFSSREAEMKPFEVISIDVVSMDEKHSVKFEFFVKDYIQKLYPYVHTDVERQLRLEQETMAFDGTSLARYEELDILIGTDQLANVIRKSGMRFGRDASIAWDTYYGWAVLGGKQNPELPNTVNMAQITDDPKSELKDPRVQQLDRDFKAFWDLEHLGILPNEAGETEFLESYIESITRQKDGRYVVKYPFRSEKTDFDDCYAIAKKRLLGLLGSPKFTPEQRAQYHAIFQEYLELGFIKQANPKYTGRQAYLPHRPVIREDAQTTKIRPVFDGSVHFKHRRSFNANLEVGPNLNPDIMGILMRWRRHKIVWTADIEKAFLQIAIHPEHEQMVRFLWVKDPLAKRQEIIQYVWTRLSFGLTSSPFILRAVLLKHLREFEPSHPGIAQRTLDQLYVDDWMGGSESPEEALNQTQLVNKLLQGAKMNLGKWVTNSAD